MSTFSLANGGEGRFLDAILSRAWPVSPLAAYLLGAATCAAALAAHRVLRRPAPRRRGGNRKRRFKSPAEQHKRRGTRTPAATGILRVRPLVRAAATPASRDKVYRGLAGRMRERTAARDRRKSERRTKRGAATTVTQSARCAGGRSPETRRRGDSKTPRRRIIDHRPIARNQARDDPAQVEKSRPKTHAVATASAHSDARTWSVPSAAAAAVADRASRELFKPSTSFPRHEEIRNGGTVSGASGVAPADDAYAALLANGRASERDARRESPAHRTPTPAEGRADDKENVDRQRARAGAHGAATRARGGGGGGGAPPKPPRISKIPRRSPRKSEAAGRTASPAQETGAGQIPRRRDRQDHADQSEEAVLDGTHSRKAQRQLAGDASANSVTPRHQRQRPQGPVGNGLATKAEQLPGKDSVPKFSASDKGPAASTARWTVLISKGVTLSPAKATGSKTKPVPKDRQDHGGRSEEAALDAKHARQAPRGATPQRQGQRSQPSGGTGPAATAEPPPSEASVPASDARAAARLTLLVSKGVPIEAQRARQAAAAALLEALGLPFAVVDGMDPAQRRVRDAFFARSGIRGNYPQLFAAAAGGGHVYLGGHEWLQGRTIGELQRFARG